MGFFNRLFGGRNPNPSRPQPPVAPKVDNVSAGDADGGPVELNDEERSLLLSLGIDEATGLQVKNRTRQKIEGLYQPFWAESEEKEPLLRGVKSIFRGKEVPSAFPGDEEVPTDIHFFKCGEYASDKNKYIAVVKAADRFEILRIMETNGVNYDVSTEDIIEFLKKWEKIPFLITECEADTVLVQLDGRNADLPEMIAAAVAICPDLLTDEATPENLGKLLEYVRSVGEIDFWWD